MRMLPAKANVVMRQRHRVKSSFFMAAIFNFVESGDLGAKIIKKVNGIAVDLPSKKTNEKKNFSVFGESYHSSLRRLPTR
jgi:hypothetical protein